MKITECAYYMNESLIGSPAEHCSLFPQVYSPLKDYRFIPCVAVPISKCPYKLFMLGKIDKEELNKRIMELCR
jgi:hypothetical protein